MSTLGCKSVFSNAYAAMRVCCASPEEWVIMQRLFEAYQEGNIKGDAACKKLLNWKKRRANQAGKRRAKTKEPDVPPPIPDVTTTLMERALYSGEVDADQRQHIMNKVADGDMTVKEACKKAATLKKLTAVLSAVANVLGFETFHEVTNTT